MAALQRWNQLSEFIRIILWTGQVKTARPQSIILVSDPGHGKTELLHRFQGNAQATFWSDVTYRTILSILTEVVRGNVTHLFVTELQKVLNRRAAIAESTLTLLSQAMEEGVQKIGFGPARKDLQGARLGLVAATTTTSVMRKPFMIRDLQLDSRAFFVDARGTTEEIREIRKRIIVNDTSALKPIVIKAPESPVNIIVPHACGIIVDKWCDEMEKKLIPIHGARTLTRFLHTLRGVAASRGHETVTKDDVEYLYTFRNLWLKPPNLLDMEGEE